MRYIYGMRQRGFSIGCQPTKGFIERLDSNDKNYYDLIVYDRELTEEEVNRYSLEKLDDKATIVPMVKELERLFDTLNEKLFEGKLEKPVITIAPDTCRAYGWFTTYKAWKETGNENSEGYYEITVTSNYLNRDVVEIAGTLLHEMCHLYAQTNGIKDCSNNNVYHNKRFKEIAQEHGLIAKRNGHHGFSDTMPNEETAEFLKSLSLEFPLYRPTPVKATKSKRNSSIKYVCPKCGAIVRATRKLNILCEDCGVQFVAA